VCVGQIDVRYLALSLDTINHHRAKARMSILKHQRVFPAFEEPRQGTSEIAEAEQRGGPIPDATTPRDETVYAMDVHYLMFQVFHALPDIKGPAGQPVAAVHGFIQDVIGLLEKKRPDFLFCAFDSPLGETFRRRRYPAYKANRDEMPEDLRVQVGLVRRVLEAMGVPILECDGYEADDVLATIAREADQRCMLCFLVTGDKDCRQLITERVKIFNLRKSEVFDASSLSRAWGIRPDQAVDFQTLVGDAVDNVPGVALIGPKTASELLARYETLEDLLARADEVSGTKRRANLKQARESAMFTRELVRLIDSVPLRIDWISSRMSGIDHQETERVCQELGLRRLAERLAALPARVR
jgi:DNA polymerase-1